MIARVLAGSALVALWVAVGWVFAHQRAIRNELKADEAIPRPGPRANLLLLWGIVLVGLSGLLLYIAVG